MKTKNGFHQTLRSQ